MYPANSLANPDLFQHALQNGYFESRMNPEPCGRQVWISLDIFFLRWLPRASWRMLCYLCFLEESWALEWIRIRFGYVWTGKFDLNTLRVDGNIFESGKKKLRTQKYPDTCGRGLNMISRQKNAGCQMQGCQAISRQGKFPSPEALLPPHLHPNSLYGRTERRTDVRDVITKISRMNRFPKISYPWCSAGALLAPDLRYKSLF